MADGGLHVVLGAGQIGAALANALLAKGHRVRLVRRSPMTHPQAEVLTADISKLDDAKRAVAGASHVYNCMNPPYHRWHTELPPLTDNLVAALRGQPARLVVLDNLYMFGPMDGVPMKAGEAERPSSKKGALRKRLADRLLEEGKAGALNVVIVRASDFVGPGVVQAHMGERFFQRAYAGKAPECMGDPSLVHTFSYSEDVVKTLIAAGSTDGVLGRPWHVPNEPARSLSEWAKALSAALGFSISVAAMPPLLLSFLGLFVPVMRELKEMRYQWTQPYLVDDAATRSVLGVQSTPFEEQVAATAAWAKKTYGSAGPPSAR